MSLVFRSIAFLPLVLTVSLSAATYYVAPPKSGGNNSNPGILAAPFAFIQHAATAAFAGDTVLIRAGTYRETITHAGSGTAFARITYQNYDNEFFTISGADFVSSASLILGSSSVYREPLAANFLTSSFNTALQVFWDGEMVAPAMWPNVTTNTNTCPTGIAQPVDIFYPAETVTTGFISKTRYTTAGLTTGVVSDTAIPPKSAGFYDGAETNFQPKTYMGVAY